jgi:hypothetical protein
MPVRLGARYREELHARGCHSRIRGTEVLDMEEETHPPGRLLPDDSGLVFAVSTREQQAGRGTWWPDYHPPLGTPVGGPGRRVRHQLEAQYVHEEADGRVVLPDHDGDEAKVHAASIGDRPGSVPSARGNRCPDPGVIIPRRRHHRNDGSELLLTLTEQQTQGRTWTSRDRCA